VYDGELADAMLAPTASAATHMAARMNLINLAGASFLKPQQ